MTAASLSDNPHVVVIAGPTASGKSALALAIAENFHGTVINADSQQRYRDLAILTARPTPEECARAPHRLFGDLGPLESGTAAEWARSAAAEIRAATNERRLPIIVGGTGLYLRALMEGLAAVPEIPAQTRAAARARLDEIGRDAFHAELMQRDPVLAARLAPGDAQRMLRGWEVVEATGTPLSEWQQEPTVPPIAASYFKICVLPSKAELAAAFESRFDTMIAKGAIQGVAALMETGVSRIAPVMRAIGAAELAAFLAGEVDQAGAIEAGKAATRRYAKRQNTWFRHQFSADFTLSTKFSESIKEEIFSKIRRFLLTGSNTAA